MLFVIKTRAPASSNSPAKANSFVSMAWNRAVLPLEETYIDISASLYKIAGSVDVPILHRRDQRSFPIMIFVVDVRIMLEDKV